MYIIFGEDNTQQLNGKYVLLELDTIKFTEQNRSVKTFCVIGMDSITLTEMPALEHFKKLHHDLIENYRKKNWNYCEQIIPHLLGKWKSELDSFYNNLSARIDKYKQHAPGDEWDGTIEKTLIND